jgi:hypothetical protein
LIAQAEAVAKAAADAEEKKKAEEKAAREKERQERHKARKDEKEEKERERKEKKVMGLFSGVVVQTMSKYKSQFEGEAFKKRAKEVRSSFLPFPFLSLFPYFPTILILLPSFSSFPPVLFDSSSLSPSSPFSTSALFLPRLLCSYIPLLPHRRSPKSSSTKNKSAQRTPPTHTTPSPPTKKRR